MKKKLKQLDLLYKGINYYTSNLTPKSSGKKAVLSRGYRAEVGGKWETVGELQFKFMKERGLKNHHVFLDIACGSFRGGRFFIPYLDKENIWE